MKESISRTPGPSTSVEAVLRALRDALGREYAGREVWPSWFKTAWAWNGEPGAHCGFVVAQDTERHTDVREVLVVCNDGVARWFDVDEARAAL